MAGEEEKTIVAGDADELAESLSDLFTNLSSMVQGELQGTSNMLELVERMNLRVAEEYSGFGELASQLRIYVEQLNKKNGQFEDYTEQIERIDEQVTQFEAAIAMLDNHVSLLEAKVYKNNNNAPHQSSFHS